MEETPFTLRVKKQIPINSTGNEPYGCRTPAVELETGERLVRLVDLSPPPSIVEYPTFGNEGTMGLGMGLGVRLRPSGWAIRLPPGLNPSTVRSILNILPRC